MAGDSNDAGDLGLTWGELALTLAVCRDALTDLSLTLQDRLFEIDVIRRQEAEKITQELAKKLMKSIYG